MEFLRGLFRGWGKKSAADFYNEGIVAATQGDFDEAIRQLTEAIRIDPKNVDAFVNRGPAFGETGDYDRAIADTVKKKRFIGFPPLPERHLLWKIGACFYQNDLAFVPFSEREIMQRMCQDMLEQRCLRCKYRGSLILLYINQAVNWPSCDGIHCVIRMIIAASIGIRCAVTIACRDSADSGSMAPNSVDNGLGLRSGSSEERA
jgi:tetratricopeptide repeat protein